MLTVENVFEMHQKHNSDLNQVLLTLSRHLLGMKTIPDLAKKPQQRTRL